MKVSHKARNATSRKAKLSSQVNWQRSWLMAWPNKSEERREMERRRRSANNQLVRAIHREPELADDATFAQPPRLAGYL